MKADRRQWETLKSLAKYLWIKDRPDLRLRVLLSVACLVVAKTLGIAVPFFYKHAVDALSADGAVLVLPLFVIVAYGGARILSQLFSDLRDYIFVRVSAYAQRVVSLETFDHLHRLSLSFHLSRQTGGLSRMIERGTHGIQSVLSYLLFNILPTLLEILFVTLILAYLFPWVFSLVTLVTIVLYIVYTLIISDWRIQFRKAVNQSDSEANAKAIDSLLNYETVKYFGNEPLEHRRFEDSMKQYEEATVKSQATLSLLNVGQGAIIGMGLMILMGLAGQGVVDQRMTLGDFVLLNTFLIQLYLPLNFLGFVYREIKQGLIDMEKMFELLEEDSDIKDPAQPKPLPHNRASIVFENVHFSYLPERPILKGVSFAIPPGSTLAIVGPSGSGKSTLARLLFRFYDIHEGSIKVSGLDIRDVVQADLRAQMGVVPQDTVLFNDTLLYNLAYGRPSATFEEIREAARLAEIETFIEALPQRYQTSVGERGLKLSGGEKQRVAIARMLLKDPSIMIFDEATSALDSKTEKEIQSALSKVSRGKTTLMIAHRLSTVVDADQIVVLVAGQVREQGTHAQLLEKKGIYFDMWQEQMKSMQVAGREIVGAPLFSTVESA